MMVRPENSRDRWIADAATIAGARHDVSFLKAVAVAGKFTHNARTLKIVGTVAEHHARGGKSEAIDELVQAFASADAAVAGEFVKRFAANWRGGKVTITEPTEKAMAKLLTRLAPAAQGQLLQLSSTWGVKGLDKHIAENAKTLFDIVSNDKKDDDERLGAANQLLNMGGNTAETVDKLLATATPQASPEFIVGMLEMLGANGSPEVGKTLAKRLPTLSPKARVAALRVLLTTPDRTLLLLDAVSAGTVKLGELTPDQKQALLRHTNAEVKEKAKVIIARGGGLPDADREKVINELTPLLAKKGDVKVGQAVFTKNCSTCHMHSGQGNKVGPDLTGMAVHPKSHLLEEIMDPSRNVEGNFRLYNVTKTNGVTLSGIVAAESKTTVELIDAQAKTHQLLRDEIDTIVATNKSLMPDGFEKTLTNAELVDLLEFLTARGQFFAVPLAKAATVVTTLGMFNSKDNEAERLIFADWGPKQFKGVPFQLVDPQGEKTPNAILLYGPQGSIPPKMPKSVTIPCGQSAKAIHMLSGVSGWGYPYGKQQKNVVVIVRLHYADGKTEDHALKNGEHFADYISRNDVPGSEFAFALRTQQIRYLKVLPERDAVITEIEFVKGPDNSAPVIMAVTVESR